MRMYVHIVVLKAEVVIVSLIVTENGCQKCVRESCFTEVKCELRV